MGDASCIIYFAGKGFKTLIVSMHLTANLSYYGGVHRRLQMLGEYNDPAKCRMIIASLTEKKDFKISDNSANTLVHAFKIGGKNWGNKIKMLKDFIRNYNVDIIHAYGTQCQFLSAIIGKMIGIPVVAWEIGIPKYSKLKSRLGDSLAELFIDERVCNSHATLRATLLSSMIKRAKRHVLYPGVQDRAYFSEPLRSKVRKKIRRELSIKPDDKLLMTIGGFVPWRDQITTINALTELQRENISVKLLFIGNGPQRSFLENFVEKKKLQSDVLFLGYVRDAPKMLPAADIYINTAYKEGFGFATAEAMFAALPIVAADAGANPELIEDRSTGLLVAPRCVSSLKNAITHLLCDYQFAAQLAQGARSVALGRFSVDRFVQEHIQMCYRLVGKKDVAHL